MATNKNVQTLAARSARRTLDWIEELVQEAAFLRKQENHGAADWLEHHLAEHLKPLHCFQHQTAVMCNINDNEHEYWSVSEPSPCATYDGHESDEARTVEAVANR